MFLCSLLFFYGFCQKGHKTRECASVCPTHPQGEFLRNSNRLLRRAYPLSRETRCVFEKNWGNRGYRGTDFRALLVGAYTFFLKVYGKIPDFPDFPLPRYIHISTANSVSSLIPANDKNARLTDFASRALSFYYVIVRYPQNPRFPRHFTEDIGVFTKY